MYRTDWISILRECERAFYKPTHQTQNRISSFLGRLLGFCRQIQRLDPIKTLIIFNDVQATLLTMVTPIFPP